MLKGNMFEVFETLLEKQAVADLTVQREADEYLCADALSIEGYGTITSLLSRMQQCTDGELLAWIEIATTLDNRGELCYNGEASDKFCS